MEGWRWGVRLSTGVQVCSGSGGGVFQGEFNGLTSKIFFLSILRIFQICTERNSNGTTVCT